MTAKEIIRHLSKLDSHQEISVFTGLQEQRITSIEDGIIFVDNYEIGRQRNEPIKQPKQQFNNRNKND